MANVNKFSTINRLRLRAMLRDRGLDQPLDDHEMALQLLDTELRLEQAESTLDDIIDALQGQNIYLTGDEEDPHLG